MHRSMYTAVPGLTQYKSLLCRYPKDVKTFGFLAMMVAIASLGGAGAARSQPSSLAPKSAEAKEPSWSLKELQGLLAEIAHAGRAAHVSTKDQSLIVAAARGYGVERLGGEPAESFARRVLRTRSPHHPNVKRGQWLVALMRQVYLDVAARSRSLARFARDRKKRKWLEDTAKEADGASRTLVRELQVEVDGLEGFIELPPRVGGRPLGRTGARAEVQAGAIVVERLPRSRFKNHRPPPEAARTRNGSLREVYSALRQFDTTARMLGQYDPAWRKKLGHLQLVIPAAYPAIYLNEIVRAAKEARVKVLHLITLNGEGELREITMRVDPPRRARGKKILTCADGEPMPSCAGRLAHAQATFGTFVYKP